MPTDGHLSAERLVRVAGDELGDAERREALAHLEECEDCGDRLATILLLRQGRRRRGFVDGRVGLLAAAAGLVLILGAWVVYVAGSPGPETPAMTAEQQALAQRWGAYATRENVPDLLYDFTLRIQFPDIVPVSPDRRYQRTRQAVVDIRDERYDVAIEELMELSLQYPEFDTIAGWLGVALHLSGETDPLVGELLERATETGDGLLRDAGLWYGAQQLLLTGRPQPAVEKLEVLARVNDHIGRLARAQLEELPLDELEQQDERI